MSVKYVARREQPRAVRTADDWGDALAIPTVVDDGVTTVDTGLVNKEGVKIHRVIEREFGFRVRR